MPALAPDIETRCSNAFGQRCELSVLNDAEIVDEIRHRLAITGRSLSDLAAAVAEACSRNIDLSEVIPNKKLLWTLQQIGSGRIAISLAEKYMPEPIFDTLKGLPLEDQERIADTGKVEVASDDGFKEVEVVRLTGDQKRIAFSRGRVRPREEQQAVLTQQNGQASLADLKTAIDSAIRVAAARRGRAERQASPARCEGGLGWPDQSPDRDHHLSGCVRAAGYQADPQAVLPDERRRHRLARATVG